MLVTYMLLTSVLHFTKTNLIIFQSYIFINIMARIKMSKKTVSQA